MTEADAGVAPVPARDVLPDALLDREQWLCWQRQDRDGKPTKVPIDTAGGYASATDADTWTRFDAAADYAEGRPDVGVGFVFTAGDPFVGVDLDGCRDPETGRPDDTAKGIVDTLDSYTEVSPSGTGYHVLVEGSLPGDRNRHGDVEMYESARFFTMSGMHVEGTPTRIHERSEQVAEVHEDHVAQSVGERSDSEQGTVTRTSASASAPASAATSSMDDDALLEKAKNAANGEKFRRLWNGSTAGYPSHSEADMALCSLLGFWTGGDADQIDRLFRQSGLYREKWDEQHFADGSTYGEVTVRRAIETLDDVYEPPAGETGGGDAVEAADDSSDNSEPDVPAERIATLSRLVRQKNERIAALEDQVEELETELAQAEGRLEEVETTAGPSGRPRVRSVVEYLERVVR